jgi:hypothetical protein
MKTCEATIKENSKEDPESEPDQDQNTWLIAGKLDQDIPNWENAELGFRSAEIGAEFLEGTCSGPDTFTLRTRGQSPLKKGDVIHVDVRGENVMRVSRATVPPKTG